MLEILIKTSKAIMRARPDLAYLSMTSMWSGSTSLFQDSKKGRQILLAIVDRGYCFIISLDGIFLQILMMIIIIARKST